MKIALLSFEYPPETGFGGIGSYTWHHARALTTLGHEVHVLAGAREATAHRVSEHGGVRVFRLPRRRLMILFTGRMERRKGIHLCTEIALAILQRCDVTFVLAGQTTSSPP